jgi:ABC-2 type transport system permease protein
LGITTAKVETGIARGVVEPAATAALGADLGADFIPCAAVGRPFTTEVTTVAGGDANFDGAAHALAGMGLQFILLGAVDAAVGMLTERQKGLFRRLQAAPLSRAVLIASRLISGAVIALAVIVFLYAFGSATMGIAIKGSRVGFALVAVTFALLASSLGVLIATFGKTPQATRGVGVMIILIATFLSGAWLPAFMFPAWMQRATLAVPSRWALDGLDAMTWRGLDLDAALAPAGVLVFSAAICAGWAALRFRWEE